MSKTSDEVMADAREQASKVQSAQEKVEELARQQGVRPIVKAEELLGNFWPEEEDIEDFLTALREWRNEGSREIGS